MRGTTTSGAEGCIIGEPTGMTVVIAHKGTSHFLGACAGQGGAFVVCADGESCNAIDYATKLITKLREIAEEYRRNGTRHDFQVPFSTLSTNLISGGNASNTVPAECEFLFEFRALPNETVSKMMQQVRSYVETQLLPAMKAEFEDAEIVITPRMKHRRLRAVRRRPSPSWHAPLSIITSLENTWLHGGGPLQWDCRRTNRDMRTPWRGHTLCE
ncbi:putative metallo-peptidase, clan MH, family M18 [Trypanosoma cruzi]|uniref:Putative metallo-peptidase, clan MH, family M18 n=1 Tax=Trypanosoma cruzi TaxID=5693 RepID=A0A2V2UI45_TRYCR|nr:putative metallo-peptidase, clan MH, family M18 [Trypanosoma cruzi]